MEAIVTYRTASGGWKSVSAEARIIRVNGEAGKGDSSVEAHCDMLDRAAKAPASKERDDAR